MCNCNSGISLCSRCATGLSCGCPPNYSILPLPVECGCCPAGYTWSTSTQNIYPNGVCTGPGGTQIQPIECNPCVDSISAKCVILPSIECFGIPAGTTLYTFITTYICSPAFWAKGLEVISLDTTLKAMLCDINSTCPAVGSGAPIALPLVVTVP